MEPDGKVNIPFPPYSFLLHIRAEMNDSLIAQDWIGYKQCPVIVDARESVKIVRADNTSQ